MGEHDKTALAAYRAATTARLAADELDALGDAMSKDDLMAAINALARAMALFANLESDLVDVRDEGLVSTAKYKPVGMA